MKKIINLVILFLSFIFIVGCEMPNSTSLNLKLNDNVLEWNEYTDASSYLIYINDIYHDKVYVTKYELSLEEGSYQIKVKAVLNNGYSDFSNIVTYEVLSSKQLPAPSISLNNNKITWNEIDNALEYEIYINNSLYAKVKSCEYALSLKEGQYDIYVIACAKGFAASEKSNIITYNKVYNKTGKVNIFSINDTHGAIITDNDTPGMERVASVINELEASSDYIKVANGDIFQGGYASNVTYGRVFIDTLNAMDFDCFVIGNHEFDWGIEKISQYKDGDLSNGEAEFPFLSANIVYKNNYESPDWLEPYTIVENNGFTVGVIGIIGQYLTSSISYEYVENYTFLNPVPIVEELSKELRTSKNCDFVVVANHEYESSTNEALASLKGDSRVDAILCGHTHQKINEYVKRYDSYQIPIVQSHTKNYTVGSISLDVADQEITNTKINHYYPMNYGVNQDILNVINNYRDVIEEGNKVVTTINKNMSKSELGIFAANAIKEYVNSDFAFINTGGVRATINSGEILMKEIYEVFPFDNNIITVTMTKQQLINFCNYSDGYMYYSSNLNINNLTKDVYNVAVIDYVYTYPSYKKFFSDLDATILDDYIRDAVIWKFKEGNN